MNKFQFLIGLTLAICWSAAGQPVSVEREEPMVKPLNDLPFPLLSPAEAQKLVALPFELHLRDVTLFEALQELQKQSGVELEQLYAGMSALEKRLSLDIETTSFSRAFDAIMDEVGVEASVMTYGTGRAWVVRFGPSEDELRAPQVGSGAFQVSLIGVDLDGTKKVRLGENGEFARATSEQLEILLQMVPAPELKIIGKPRFLLTRAVDEAGNSLLQGWGDDTPFGFEPRWGFISSVSLKRLDVAPQKLARIEGKAVVVVPTRSEILQIADVTAAVGATRVFGRGKNAATLTIEEVERTQDSLSLKLQIIALAPEDAQVRNPLLQGPFVAAFAKLKSDDGGQLSVISSEDRSSDQSLTTWLRFAPDFVPQPGQQWPLREKLAYPSGPLLLFFEAPTEFAQVEVPFAFTDIPLP